jgi:hypothetical protein
MPRSGSAWLSNFLTFKDSFCYHEPLIEAPPEDLIHKFSERPEAVVGAVDTGAAHFKARLPKISTFLLVRDEDHAKHSAWKLGLKWVPSRKAVFSVGGPCFEYEKLFDLGYLRDVWDSITGLPFDEERARLAIGMNVQADIKALVKRGGF